MNQVEFIERLTQALNGEVPPAEIRSNVQFYQEYIRDEIAKGRTEEEVMEELGDPRLIARTIFDSVEAAQGKYGEPYTFNEEDDGYSRTSMNSDYHESPMKRESGLPELWNRYRPLVILAGVLVIIIGILSALFAGVAALATKPAFWVILIVLFIVRSRY